MARHGVLAERFESRKSLSRSRLEEDRLPATMSGRMKTVRVVLEPKRNLLGQAFECVQLGLAAQFPHYAQSFFQSPSRGNVDDGRI